MHKHGFTLIELLVVIAIIGMLSSIVMVSLGSARNKAADSAIKGNLSGMRASAELYRNDNANKYIATGTGGTSCTIANSVFADGKIIAAVQAAQASSGLAPVCSVGITDYAVTARLKTNTNLWYCVDSSGGATTTVGNRISSATDYNCQN